MIEERIEKMPLTGGVMLVDFERGQPLELESLFLAAAAGATGRRVDHRNVWPHSAGVLAGLDPAKRVAVE